MIEQIIDFLDGKKTYLGAFLIMLSAILQHFGIIDDQVFKIILTLLGAGSIMALRAGVKKSE